MREKLNKLYNTMVLIETKGESTKLMAICLNYVAQLINERSVEETKKEGDFA